MRRLATLASNVSRIFTRSSGVRGMTGGCAKWSVRYLGGPGGTPGSVCSRPAHRGARDQAAGVSKCEHVQAAPGTPRPPFSK
eukprot:350389-Chlamydomonas_euryale.AAC.5